MSVDASSQGSTALLEEVRSFVQLIDSNRKSTQISIQDQAYEQLLKILRLIPSLALSIKPVEIYFGEKSVYANKMPKQSMSFQFYEGGLRQIRFRQEIEKDEFVQILKLLGTDFHSSDSLDQDLYSLFVENLFNHFDVMGDDPLAEALRKDPSLRDAMKSYLARNRRSDKPKREGARQLREADIKAIEDSHLNSKILIHPPEHLEKLRLVLLESRSSDKQEKEKLERLLRMGLFFLDDASASMDRIAVGRDIVSQVCVMMLENRQTEKFLGILEDFQNRRTKVTEGDSIFNEAFEVIFDAKHSQVYAEALADKQLKSRLLKIFTELAPPSIVKLLVKMLSKNLSLMCDLGGLLAKFIPLEMEWIAAEAGRHPDSPVWDALLDFGSKNASAEFKSFAFDLLKIAGPPLKDRIHRYLASTGSTEALKYFKANLESKISTEEKLKIYESLSQSLAKTKLSFRMFKAHLESAAFAAAPGEERKAAYRCLANLAGEVASPFFLKLWQETGHGSLFQRRANVQEQKVLIEALAEASPATLKKLLSEIDQSSLEEESQELIRKMNIRPEFRK